MPIFNNYWRGGDWWWIFTELRSGEVNSTASHRHVLNTVSTVNFNHDSFLPSEVLNSKVCAIQSLTPTLLLAPVFLDEETFSVSRCFWEVDKGWSSWCLGKTRALDTWFRGLVAPWLTASLQMSSNLVVHRKKGKFSSQPSKGLFSINRQLVSRCFRLTSYLVRNVGSLSPLGRGRSG